jgi:hypothetical protein
LLNHTQEEHWIYKWRGLLPIISLIFAIGFLAINCGRLQAVSDLVRHKIVEKFELIALLLSQVRLDEIEQLSDALGSSVLIIFKRVNLSSPVSRDGSNLLNALLFFLFTLFFFLFILFT